MLIIRFASHMITESVQVFWAELQRGEFITDAAVAAGTYRKQGSRWVVANGGVRPRRGRDLKGRPLRDPATATPMWGEEVGDCIVNCRSQARCFG